MAGRISSRVVTVAVGVLALAGGLAAAKLKSSARQRANDASAQTPGAAHKIAADPLPKPFATRSADRSPHVVPRPEKAWPQVPRGFRVSLYAEGLERPRALRVAPNADVFVSESWSGRVRVLRGVGKDGRAAQIETFASDLEKPFGLAFWPPGKRPQALYVGDTDAVLRFPYYYGDLKARGAPTKIADLPGGGLLRGGGHWTRDLAISPDGKKLYVSVGSFSNVDDPDDHPGEKERADILEMTIDGNNDGKDRRVYASGIRNAVGLAISPRDGALWASVNERDELGDELVPDYVTRVVDGGFYGWPYFYIGGHADPRLGGKHAELASKVIVPDVLVEPHAASMQLVFYDGEQFPAAYNGNIFAAQHGSWNRSALAGYEVVRIPVDDKGRALGGYEDFMTGFANADGEAWGRPVGIAVDGDGGLLVSDDVGNCIWRIEAAPP